MKNRERVLAALNHQTPDKVPYNVGFTHKAHEKMVEYYGDPDFCSKMGNCLVDLNCEPEGSWKEVMPGLWEDQFGVQWDRTVDKDIGVVSNLLVTLENVDQFSLPDPDEPSRFKGYEGAVANNPDGFFVVDLGFSLFERAWTLCGMENLLMWMITEKDAVHKLFDRILEFNMQLIGNVCKYDDMDAMLIGDDWGQQIGLIMGPELWREFIKPRIRQMYGKLREHDKYVFIHSCGKVEEIFPDLIECGLHVFNPFQPEVIDVYEAKKKYGKDLSFYGGISTQKTLPYGTVDEVKDEVKRLIDGVGANGGYIASPAHATPADAKAENIAAMIEVLQNQ